MRTLYNPIFSLFLLVQLSIGQDRITGEPFATRSVVLGQNGMVATSHPLATQIGLDMLKNGGNAIDAAIAANAALGLMEPTGCGIGGDLFAIVWDGKTKKLYGLNASGRSPKKLTLEYFEKEGMEKIPSHGPLPVSVPGAVDGWFELHDKFGSKPMTQILAPAIAYADKRFPLTELIAWYMQRTVPFFESKGFLNIEDTATENPQISTSDPDSRHQIVRGTITEVCYSAQTTVDAEHKLLIDYKITNQNDKKAMGGMLRRAKAILGTNAFTALYDKGYHTGSEFATANDLGIDTLTAIPAIGRKSQAPDTSYNAEHFKYDDRTDAYT